MMHTNTFVEVSHNVKVSVRPAYLENHSDLVKQNHVFVYFISITNKRSESVKLDRRHWEIEDSSAGIYQVDGEGVVGKKPDIQPGATFEYNSSCVLKSYRGKMKGYYVMVLRTGERITVKIPAFYLVSYKLN